MNEQTRYRYGPDFTCAEDANGEWVIDGYASTDAVDSYNEVIEPEAFRKWLPRFFDFPILLVNHGWFDIPIGKVTEAEIRPNGLWVKAIISKTAPDIWALIQEGILKAFSVGFSGVTFEKPMEPGKPGIWKEIQLLEISVVNVPANREALFAVASGRGFNLSRFTSKGTNQPTTTKTGGAGMDTITLDQVKTVAGETVKDQTPTLLAAAKSNAETVAKAAITGVESKVNDLAAELKAFKDAADNTVTKAELDALIAKAVGPLTPLIAEHQRKMSTGLPNAATCGFYEMKTAPLSRMEAAIAKEANTTPLHIRSLIHKPEHVLPKSDSWRIDAMRNFQQASDDLLFLDTIMRAHSRNYGGPKTLKYWSQVYKPALAEFQRAMDTATTSEGTEWVPTMMSAQFLEIFELERKVARLFDTFPMPSKTFDWPIQSSAGTAYLPGESTADSATAISASTPGTSKVTFTAKKLAGRFLTSTEFVEDAAVEVLGFLRAEMAATLARGEEDAIINGDTAGTHQDSNVTAADDVKKAWLGLRAWCHDQTNTTDLNGAFALTALTASRKSMGKYGVQPLELVHILSPVTYLSAVADSNVLTWDKFGPMATGLTGELPTYAGIPLVASEKIPVNLNASGVYDGSTTDNTVTLTVHRPSWKIGTRRMVTIDVEKLIATDQFHIVGTIREDFQPMRGTSEDIAWEQYDVTYP